MGSVDDTVVGEAVVGGLVVGGFEAEVAVAGASAA